MKQRILIITYYWPPAGGPGVQRWLKFVKYLPEFGVEPVVFAPKNPYYPVKDKSLAAEIPEGIKILRYPVREPFKLLGFFLKKKTRRLSSGQLSHKKPPFFERLLLSIRGNRYIPDARVGWVKPSVRFLEKYLRKQDVNMVITTGPPHSLHLIGLALKEKLGVRWAADFRDPWTSIGYHKRLRLSKKAQEKHEVLEFTVLQNADLILTTGPATKKEFEALTDKPIQVITNGYDDEIAQTGRLDEKFTLSHIGLLHPGRNPAVLWQVLTELCNEDKSFSHDLELRLAGTVNAEVRHSIKVSGLGKNVSLPGYLSHEEAVAMQRSSQVLLLVEADSIETRAIIPGKLFEYMAAGRPILALGPQGSDIGTIINHTNTGRLVHYGEKERLKEIITTYYEQYKAGQLEVSPVNIGQYHRKTLTEKLVSAIKNDLGLRTYN